MTAQFPSSTNTFVANHEASGKLVVDFVNSPSKFRLSDYIQIVDVKQPIGYYLKMTIEEAARIINADLSDFLWPDGADASLGEDGVESFEFLQYRTERYRYPFTLGEMTIENATWDIVAQHAAIKAHQAMTARTVKAITALTTSGNYDSTHTSTIAALTSSGHTWANSTSSRQDIKNTLNQAAERIMLDTNSVVQAEDLRLVISPTLARNLSSTQEIVDLIKQSPEAGYYVRGEGKNLNKNSRFGLPPTLYGYEVVVENAVRVSTRKGATTSRGFVMGSTVAALLARPGSLEGVANAPSFSTLTCFTQENMTVETKADTDNRRTTGRVVDNFAMVMTAPVAGYLFTGCA